VFFVAAAPVFLAADAAMAVTPITSGGQGLVTFEMADAFTPEGRDAISSGLPATFTYVVDVRPVSALFDRTIASVTVAASVRFDNLTRRYQLSRSVDGRLEEAKAAESPDAVREWMTRFERVSVAATDALEANAEYAVRVRAYTRPRNSWFLRPW